MRTNATVGGMQKETVVISIGGSLIVPDQIDTVFLSDLKSLITAHVDEGFRFALIAGGGKLARRYQAAANEITTLRSEDLDWLGIHSTRLNAHLLRSIFYKDAYPILIKNPVKKLEAKEAVIVGAGWKPGRSTDYVAVRLAKMLGAKKLVNLSDIDYVYEANPDTHPDAKHFEHISWKEFRKIIPRKWDPGLSSPFDPIAAKEAEKFGLEVAIMNGAHLDRLEKYLKGHHFIGTVIA